MPRKSDAKERMILSGVELFRERGLQGTAFADVLEHSGAPRGSVYYHFPGGKEQFSAEVVQFAGKGIARGLRELLAEHGPAEALGLFVEMWSDGLVRSEFKAGCPVLAAIIDGDEAEPAREQAAVAFRRWDALLADALIEAGIARQRAQAFSTLALAAIEGAVALSRAERSVAPLQRVAELLREQLDDELAAAGVAPAA